MVLNIDYYSVTIICMRAEPIDTNLNTKNYNQFQTPDGKYIKQKAKSTMPIKLIDDLSLQRSLTKWEKKWEKT